MAIEKTIKNAFQKQPVRTSIGLGISILILFFVVRYFYRKMSLQRVIKNAESDDSIIVADYVKSIEEILSGFSWLDLNAGKDHGALIRALYFMDNEDFRAIMIEFERRNEANLIDELEGELVVHSNVPYWDKLKEKADRLGLYTLIK